MAAGLNTPTPDSILITGAAGFIGSHLVDRLLGLGHRVIGLDNLSRGSRAHLAGALKNPAFRLVEMDLAEPAACAFEAGEAIGTLWHLAANSDIPAGVADASIDRRDTFLTTCHALELARSHGAARFCFASSSAIYGDPGPGVTLREDSGPLLPISNYGAMKLASEAAISAAVESTGLRAYFFRFPNVVGGRATHGILYDLIGRIVAGADELTVLGDGSQQKPYLHVSELVEAMLYATARAAGPRNCFNIGPEDDGIAVRAIVDAIVAHCAPALPVRYGGGGRGWVGDVPRFAYSTARLAELGWRAGMTSRQAIERAIEEIHAEMTGGRPCR